MKILIISTQNPFRTSGIVAYNLYMSLKDNNNQVKVLIKHFAEFESSDLISMETRFSVFIERWEQKIKRRLAKIGLHDKIATTHPDYHVQDYNQRKQFYSTKAILKKVGFKPDVILYLFQQNFLTAKNLYELNQITKAKILWYLMDTAPLTGLCHYSWDCVGYTIGCGKCPAIYSDKSHDQSYKNMMYKNKFLSKTNIEIIAATEQQKKQLKTSFLFKDKPIHKILLSIDPEVFKPICKLEAKKKWNITFDKKVIFFGGTSINDTRKGMNYLIESIRILQSITGISANDILLLVAGNSDILLESLPFEARHIGFLANNEQLASAYQAADIFACPSIEDAGPMMINQSIMTGTPVVSFEMGVALDLVIPKKTGYRAKLKDYDDFANGLKIILELDNFAYKEMSDNCRKLALELYAPSVIKRQFDEIFIN